MIVSAGEQKLVQGKTQRQTVGQGLPETLGIAMIWKDW